MSLADLLARWKNDPDTAPNIALWRTTLARPAALTPFPADLPRPLADALHARGLTSLYSHQSAAWNHVRAGENIALATGTASGKTLGYNLPVLASLIENPQARALYIFPTKALTQDQLTVVSGLLTTTNQQLSNTNRSAAIYDGDTPQAKRKAIREKANIIFTNPDMLHTGILPHHTNWADYFRNLKFVVIDEMHTYRGVFGSHVANVIRRLKRVAAFYGAHPQFILTSATIGNPKELAERLIEAPVTLIDNDGSSRGERHFLIYNPPIVEESLGLRKSALLESVRLTQELLAHDIQNVVFARSRRSVEILLTYLQPPPNPPPFSGKMGEGQGGGREVRGYRSGYLPSQRREIEKGLRDGSVKTVVATNALELGIDIGGLGAAVLVGYPGTIASVYQQAGRAGRGDDPALSVLVATPNPLDQFLAHHPDYFFGRSPEQALVNPDHLLILLNHLRCAIFELPLKKGEGFGALDAKTVEEFLEFLIINNEAHRSQDKYFWMADSYPAASVSLRSASPESVVLQSTDSDGQPTIIGEVDYSSALWMVHPNAVYLHEAQQYYVQDLNLTQQRATLIPVALDYYTEPVKEVSVKVLSVNQEEQLTTKNTEKIKKDSVNSVSSVANKGSKAYGELEVTTQVVGFKKLRWFTRENLGQEPLDLPPTDFQTTGYWLSIADETVKALTADGLWTNAPNDYGPDWPRIRERVRARDGFRCQVCGAAESRSRQHDVHHKIPFRSFRDESGRLQRERANQLDNLATLCHSCHRNVEQNVRMRSGLAGLSYVLSQLAPLYLMCDPGDLGTHIEPVASESFPLPSVVLYDLVPAGIGFSQKLFEMHTELIARALELVSECPCEDGCPSCVGPGGENGYGGKLETLALLKEFVQV